MTFKDSLTEDLDSCFINMDEFASTHELDGKQFPMVLEGLTTKQFFARAPVTFDGVHGQTLVVHCKTVDIVEVPVVGNTATLDGEVYRVADCVDDMGLVTIILEVDVI